MALEWIDAPAVGDAELRMLEALWSPLTAAELAGVLDADPDGIAPVVDRLLSAGLVRRSGPGEPLVVTPLGLDARDASGAGLHEPSEPAAVITPYRDGPLVVRGPFRLVDQDGAEIDVDRETVALCRCGRSRIRPFCDGTHKLTRFSAPSGAENRQRHLGVAPPKR